MNDHFIKTLDDFLIENLSIYRLSFQATKLPQDYLQNRNQIAKIALS